MSFGQGNKTERIEQLEARIKELEEDNAAWEVMCKNAFKKLMKAEQLVRDMCRQLHDGWDDETYAEYMGSEGFDKRLAELGIDTEGGA